MKHLALVAALALGGCAQLETIKTGLQTANTAVVSGDQLLRDKCDYAQDGARIVETAINEFDVADNKWSKLALALAGEINRYCTGKPIVNLADALTRLEKRIVEVRPVAAVLNK